MTRSSGFSQSFSHALRTARSNRFPRVLGLLKATGPQQLAGPLTRARHSVLPRQAQVLQLAYPRMVAKEQSQPQIRGRVKRTDSNEAPQMFFAALSPTSE